VTDDQHAVRVRFPPSPSGDLHVGNIRTALYDWAFARRTGGTFVLRIEDTDKSRVTDEYIYSALDTLRWLGLDWDEGPTVGGKYGPYLQSQRLDIYADWARRFLESGAAYYCYCTQEELAARRAAARAGGGPSGYDGHCRDLTPAQIAAYEAEGRRPVLRLRMPEGSTTFTDVIRGEITISHRDVPDFVLVRADGSPLYTLAVAVDDVMMKITHIVRGEDLLSSTPRQIAVYRAMGVPDEDFPVFAHLPYVLGQDNQKLSKRNGVVSINWYRNEGFLPEAICNYLALLGWSPGENRELFTLGEMAAEFDVTRVNKNAARFDARKLEAINGDKIRGLAPDDFASRIVPFLGRAGLVTEPPSKQHAEMIKAAAPLIQERVSRLTEAPDMLGFLLLDEDHFTVALEDAEKVLTADAAGTLKAAIGALEDVTDWTAASIEEALRAALIEGLGLRPRTAFAPLRVAVTGRRVSPPLFESMELLGRERTLSRLARVLLSIPGRPPGCRAGLSGQRATSPWPGSSSARRLTRRAPRRPPGHAASTARGGWRLPSHPAAWPGRSPSCAGSGHRFLRRDRSTIPVKYRHYGGDHCTKQAPLRRKWIPAAPSPAVRSPAICPIPAAYPVRPGSMTGLAGAFADHQHGRGLTEIADLGAGRHLAEAARGLHADGRDVPAQRGERWMDQFAQHGVVPGHDRQVGRHVNPHPLRLAESGDGHHVIVVDDRGGRLGAAQQFPGGSGPEFPGVVRLGRRDLDAREGRHLVKSVVADLGVPVPGNAGHAANTPVPEPGEVGDGGLGGRPVVVPDGGQ
jgi:glutamyl-tRNA synthetase